MTRGSRLRPLAKAVLRTQSDDRLVALTREGREAAFEEIVRRYRPGLVAFAAAYAPSDRVEDVVQEGLVRSWEALGQTSEEIHLKPWLYTIVRNRALDERRSRGLSRARHHCQPVSLLPLGDPELSMDQRDRLRRVAPRRRPPSRRA